MKRNVTLFFATVVLIVGINFLVNRTPSQDSSHPVEATRTSDPLPPQATQPRPDRDKPKSSVNAASKKRNDGTLKAARSELTLGGEAVWHAAEASNDINDFRSYLRSYPQGKHAAEAKGRIVDIGDRRWGDLSESASAQDISNFLTIYPESSHSGDAKRLLERVNAEEASWEVAKAAEDVDKVRAYLRSYPQGRHVAEAKNVLSDMADIQWTAVAASRSEEQIRNFIKAYPESNHVRDSESRIEQFYDDFQWVKEKNTLAAYRQYLLRHPDDSHRAEAEKKIIDLEVSAIVAGDHGTLPPAQRVSNANSYGGFADVCVQNDTSYELTVRYSGPDSKKLIISTGESGALQLPVGAYTVAASVSAAYVRNYAGSETLDGGRYSSVFYIRSSSLPFNPLPRTSGDPCRR